MFSSLHGTGNIDFQYEPSLDYRQTFCDPNYRTKEGTNNQVTNDCDQIWEFNFVIQDYPTGDCMHDGCHNFKNYGLAYLFRDNISKYRILQFCLDLSFNSMIHE